MALTCLFLKSIFSTVKKRRYITLIVNLKTPPFLQTEWLLFNFCKSKKEAKQNYKDFVEGADVEALDNPYKQIPEGFILGDLDFVNWVKEKIFNI